VALDAGVDDFVAKPVTPEILRARVVIAQRRLALDAATVNAKRLGLSRRGFLVAACGAASTLLAMNEAYAACGRRGGYYELSKQSAVDLQIARSALERKESRGGHTRNDYPTADPIWGKQNVVVSEKDGEVSLRLQPLSEMPDDLAELFEEKK